MTELIGNEIEYNFGIELEVNKNKITINAQELGSTYGDKIDMIEKYAECVVEFIRQSKQVFDVVAEIDYEEINLTIIY